MGTPERTALETRGAFPQAGYIAGRGACRMLPSPTRSCDERLELSLKLATMQDGNRDGYPVIVSQDLAWSASVRDVAPNMLALIERWDEVSAELEARYAKLNAGRLAGADAFHAARAAAPLPRAPQWLDGSAFPTHGERMVKAFGLSDRTLNLDFPLMYQGMSDDFLGAHAAMPLPSEDHGIDLEAELAVITAAVPIGASSSECSGYIRLLALLDDVSLRNLLFTEMSLGFGMIQCKPTCVFSPVCVTPDELGPAWRDGKMHLTMTVHVNDKLTGQLSGGEMGFRFGDLIAHAARTRKLSAGTIIGSGTFSNADTTRGTACISEARALEKMEFGAPRTGWLRFGDRVRIEVLDEQGHSIFGAIDHTFVQASSSQSGLNSE
jgi:fumarylacetoacetate (FAA) hydrolase